jgi:hypothetical protein
MILQCHIWRTSLHLPTETLQRSCMFHICEGYRGDAFAGIILAFIKQNFHAPSAILPYSHILISWLPYWRIALNIQSRILCRWPVKKTTLISGQIMESCHETNYGRYVRHVSFWFRDSAIQRVCHWQLTIASGHTWLIEDILPRCDDYEPGFSYAFFIQYCSLNFFLYSSNHFLSVVQFSTITTS